MLFTEPTFLFLFLPILLASYFAQRSRWHGAYANVLLLVASVVFYAKGGGSFTWLMLGSIAFNYWIAIGVDRARGTRWSRPLLGGAIALNLAVLAVFKYVNFFAENLNALLASAGAQPFSAPKVLLPIGISFYTFHAISYLVDVHRRHAAAQKNPVHAALYMLLFPQLIAGPIIRYRDIADQLARRIVTLDDFAEGVRRFILGFAKKMLIANVVAGPADKIFALPAAEVGPTLAWLGITCYTLQIYFDFSGYSDMAIGLGRMFGFRFPENFNYPYVAESVQEFWRRWHISLSTWFRDYLYLPLGGNRVALKRMYANLVLVFLLCGLWHGASWSFVVWGLFHGAFLVAERLGLADRVRALPAPLRHGYLLLVVAIGWVFFRAETLAQALWFLGAMAGIGAAEVTPFSASWYLTPELGLAIVAGVVGATPLLPALGRWRERVATPGRGTRGLELASASALMLLFALSITQMAARSYNPFIYFRF